MNRIGHFLTFASDADLLALAGLGFLILAVLANFADRARSRRDPFARMAKVGWVPWTAIFMASMVIGGGMLALALPRVIASL